MTITVRKANIQDLEPLAQLFNSYRQFYEQPSDFVLAKTFLTERFNKQESVILVAESVEKKLIGFCQIYPSFCSIMAAKIGVLYDLFVDTSAHKTGTGHALMLAAHNYAANNGMVRLDLSTAKNNLKAQALYESLGWVRDNVFYTYSKTILT